MRVSPGPGQRGVAVTKSMFREPIMVIWGFLADGGVVVGVVLDIFVWLWSFGVWCSGGLGAMISAVASEIQLKDVEGSIISIYVAPRDTSLFFSVGILNFGMS